MALIGDHHLRDATKRCPILHSEAEENRRLPAGLTEP
jgi:hypothetical protein